MNIDVLLSKITIIAEYAAGILTALLALDNAVDATAKAFGNKQIDTLCGVIGLKLSDWISKLQGKPITGSSATTTTIQTTGV